MTHRKWIFGAVAIVSFLAFCKGAAATTLYVDESVPSSGDGTSWQNACKTIQKGIDAAAAGDTIIVAPGTYIETIQFGGKKLILTSTKPLDPDVVADTIIDGNQAGSVVTFSGTETTACLLTGFTIRNGSAQFGGGIRGNDTLAAIRQNIITGNSAGDGGGVHGCKGVIENNSVTENLAASAGGGLCYCSGIIRNNVITGNRAEEG